jgi:hypothetical protein
MSWAHGDFSEELLNLKPENAIGLTLECEDGIHRKVENITFSFRWPWKVIINEGDPMSEAGHFINVLSLQSQVIGKGVPSLDAQKAFEKVMRLRFAIREDGSFDRPPEGKKFFIPYFDSIKRAKINS